MKFIALILSMLALGTAAASEQHAMTAGDLAFLKALYYLDTGLGPSLSRDSIQDNMTRQLALRYAPVYQLA